MSLDARLQPRLQALAAQELYRRRRVIDGSHGVEIQVDGRRCINFCSNDYLGLAADPRLAAASQSAARNCGTGSGAAALVSGYNREHQQLEAALADYVGRPRALLFSSGWAANLGVIRALLDRDSTLIADELNHASLIDGGRLSGARYERVAHAQIDAYARALAGLNPGASSKAPLPALVATDSVFSMDGDLAPIASLHALCQQHQVPLLVDDAHGFGVLADPAARIPVQNSIYVATLGKALGGSGAFVAGSEALIEYLIQRGRTWVFSTAPPPAAAAAALAALQILRGQPEMQAQLQQNIARFRAGALQLGLPLAAGLAADDAPLTPIQPLMVGDPAAAVQISNALMDRGYWVAAIRPPTVPQGTSRLRITLSAAHSDAQIDALLEALATLFQAHRAAGVAAC